MDLRVLATFAAGVFWGVLFAGLDLEDILNASQPSIHRCFSPRYWREVQRDDGDGEANDVMGVDSGTADVVPGTVLYSFLLSSDHQKQSLSLIARKLCAGVGTYPGQTDTES